MPTLKRGHSEFQVLVSNKRMNALIVAAFHAAGYGGGSGMVNGDYASIVFHPINKVIGGNHSLEASYTTITLAQTLEFLFPPAIEVKLNKEYTAIIIKGEKFVTVGCQKIPITAIDALYKALHP